MNRVARRLGMSSRSLQRFLAAEGTSFHKLLDDTRRSLAEQYLRDSDLQVAQLASVLGYTAHSTFTRAFRRWFSCSPFQWKQINRTKGRRRIPQHQRL
jgi:AraC-like DNA-binding protein